MWGARADGTFDYISKQWLEYTGVSDQDQLLWDWIEQLHPGDRERVREQWRKAVRGAIDFDCEMRIRGKTGAYRWFKTRAVPIRDRTGAIVKWYGSSTDIDDVKRDIDRLDRAFQLISDGFVGVGKDGVVQRVNPAGIELLGRSADAIVGKPVNHILPDISLAEIRAGNTDLRAAGFRGHAQLDDEGGVWLFLRRA
jgi:PAS domain S-box-containing protein